MLCFRCYFEFDVQDIETFRVMFSMYCTSNFRGLAFSVIDVCDLLKRVAFLFKLAWMRLVQLGHTSRLVS